MGQTQPRCCRPTCEVTQPLPREPGQSNVELRFTDSFQKDTWRSWVVCFAGFLLQVLIVGFLHAFGVFFAYFTAEFKTTKQATAWVGSIAYGLANMLGPFVGMLQNRFGNRIVATAGSSICVVSLFISSFATNMETLFATFSVLYGIGSALAYTPTMNLAHEYFDRHVSIATGFMVAGSSIGTLILSPLSQALVSTLGWQATFRVFAGLVSISILCGWMFGWKPGGVGTYNGITQPSNQSAERRGLNGFIRDISLWKDRVFVTWAFALAFVMFGYYIPYVHLVTYAEDLGLTADQGSAIIMTLGASTAIGRVMFGRIAQLRILHRLHMHQASMILTGMASMLLPLITSFGGLIAYVICVGLIDGCFVVLLPQITTVLMGKENANIAWGFLIGATSITFMSGPPIAGLIRDLTGSYNVTFHVAGIPIILGGLLLFFIPWAKRTANKTALPEAAELAQAEDDEIATIVEREFSDAVFNVDVPFENINWRHREEDAYFMRRQNSKELEMVIASSKQHKELDTVPKRRRCVSESEGGGSSSKETDKIINLDTLRTPLPTITEQKIIPNDTTVTSENLFSSAIDFTHMSSTPQNYSSQFISQTAEENSDDVNKSTSDSFLSFDLSAADSLARPNQSPSSTSDPMFANSQISSDSYIYLNGDRCENQKKSRDTSTCTLTDSFVIEKPPVEEKLTMNTPEPEVTTSRVSVLSPSEPVCGWVNSEINDISPQPLSCDTSLSDRLSSKGSISGVSIDNMVGLNLLTAIVNEGLHNDGN